MTAVDFTFHLPMSNTLNTELSLESSFGSFFDFVTILLELWVFVPSFTTLPEPEANLSHCTVKFKLEIRELCYKICNIKLTKWILKVVLNILIVARAYNVHIM